MTNPEPLPFERAHAVTAQTACFSVHAAADPGLLPRVVGLWAKRGLMPVRWHSAVCGRGDREVYIDLEIAGVSSELATQIAGEMRQIWGVSQVLLSLDRAATPVWGAFAVALFDHIVACNTHDLSTFRPFEVAGQRVGWVRRDLAGKLDGWPRIFDLAGGRVVLRDDLGDADARTSAMAEVCAALAAKNLLPRNRSEQFAVVASFGDAPLLRLDRAWVPAFGVRAFGVHVNGYVETPAGPDLWVGVRSADSRVDPGKLDNMVAGGQPAGLSLAENVVKEAAEEASVPEALARQARPAGAVSYTKEVANGLRRDVLFIYDLPVPADFRPASRDGEHSGFESMPAAQALQLVDETDRFKFNVNLVIIEFAIRHGILRPDHPDYLRLLHGLQSGD